jgi:hypothetical protein
MHEAHSLEQGGRENFSSGVLWVNDFDLRAVDSCRRLVYKPHPCCDAQGHHNQRGKGERSGDAPFEGSDGRKRCFYSRPVLKPKGLLEKVRKGFLERPDKNGLRFEEMINPRSSSSRPT